MGAEQLSREASVTRRPQPTSPTCSSGCCLLLTVVITQRDPVSCQFTGEETGVQRAHSLPSPAESEGLDSSLPDPEPWPAQPGPAGAGRSGSPGGDPPAPRPPLHSFRLPEILQKLQAISEKELVVDWQPETLS